MENNNAAAKKPIFNHKILAGVCLIVFLLSLIPILYLSGYNHATGDDLGYGTRTHHAWLDTRSIWQVLVAAAETVKVYWKSWQGTWFTIFLMTLQPEVFSADAYWIVPWIMLAVNIAATSLVLHEFLVKRLHLRPATFWCVDVLLLTSMIQFFPSTKSGIFWYNGATHYIVPYCLAMLAVYCFLKFEKKPGVGWFIGAFLCMACLGGSSYLAALLAPIVLVDMLLYFGKRKKHLYWLAVTFLVEGVGLYISFTSPGNKVRGGEEFGLHIGQIVETVLMCFVEGGQTVLLYLKEKPAAFVLMLAAAYLLYEGFSVQELPV